MSQTYAVDRENRTVGGGLLLAAISLLSAAAVIAGLFYARGVDERRKVLLANDGCAPLTFQPTGLECTSVHDLVSQYNSVTNPILQQLNTDVAAYSASQFRNLATAKAALTAEVTLEHSLGTSLARFTFPPALTPLVKKLIDEDDALAKLTTEQAQSSTLAQLRSFNARSQVAGTAVETDIALVGKALAKPPAASQEP
jgi:hypothetical protein